MEVRKSAQRDHLDLFPDGSLPITFREGVTITLFLNSQFPRLVLAFANGTELEYHFASFNSLRFFDLSPLVQGLVDNAERQRIGTGLTPLSFTMLPNYKPMVSGTLDEAAQNALEAQGLVILWPIVQKVVKRVNSMHGWLNTIWTQSNVSVTREYWYYADQHNYDNRPSHRLSYYTSRRAPLVVPPWLYGEGESQAAGSPFRSKNRLEKQVGQLRNHGQD